MEEPTLDNSTRNAVLGALIERSKQKEDLKKPQESTSSDGTIKENETFGELLERTFEHQAKLQSANLEELDENRKEAISKIDMSRTDNIISGILR